MDRIRHVLGVLAVVLYGPGLLYWFLIHPWARAWRRLGPTRTYLIVGPTLAGISVLLFPIRGPLLGRDLGTNWILIGLGAILVVLLAWLGLAYGRHMTHLNLTTRIGIPELSSQTQQTMVRDGLYRIVRHPIYAGYLVTHAAFVMAHPRPMNAVIAIAADSALVVRALMEERVMAADDMYRVYCRRVEWHLVPGVF